MKLLEYIVMDDTLKHKVLDVIKSADFMCETDPKKAESLGDDCCCLLVCLGSGKKCILYGDISIDLYNEIRDGVVQVIQLSDFEKKEGDVKILCE